MDSLGCLVPLVALVAFFKFCHFLPYHEPYLVSRSKVKQFGVNRISMCGFQTDAPRGVASSGKQKDVSGSSPYCFLLFKYTYCLAGNRLKDR